MSTETEVELRRRLAAILDLVEPLAGDTPPERCDEECALCLATRIRRVARGRGTPPQAEPGESVA